MQNNINLTALIGRDPAHFARRILRILYTNDELANALLPDRPAETRKHYSKAPLDGLRYEILHRMLHAFILQIASLTIPRSVEIEIRCFRLQIR